MGFFEPDRAQIGARDRPVMPVAIGSPDGAGEAQDQAALGCRECTGGGTRGDSGEFELDQGQSRCWKGTGVSPIDWGRP